MSEPSSTEAEAALTLLLEAIDEAPIPLCIYDSDDKLFACSAAYRDLHSPALDDFDSALINGDVTLQTVMETRFEARFPTEEARALVEAEVQRHRRSDDPSSDIQTDGYWNRQFKSVTSSGQVMSMNLSIDELVRKSQALSSVKEELEFQAYHDPLTELPNRRAMVEHLDTLTYGGLFNVFDVAVLHVDLDKFKAVNDTLGHDAGDMVICEASKVLRSVVRDSDMVARVGGDEFVLVCKKVPSKDTVASIAQRIVDGMKEPIPYGEEYCQIGASVGIAICETAREIGQSLINADIALYEAKRNGRSCYEFFSPRHRDRFIALQRQITAVREAMQLNAFDPYFQPQVCAKTGRLLGVEALARWIEREKGVLGPGNFLPAIAEARLADELDAMILRKSLQALVSWDQAGLNVPMVTVNVSSERLADPNIVETFKWAVDEFGVLPERIGIEILENVFVDAENGPVAQNVRSLSEAGFHTALDDFGTGHASIAGLRSLALNRVKIDRSFISNIDSQEDLRTIVSAVVPLAKNLGMDVLCEGVETQAELETVAELGCDAIQGFWIAKPMSAEMLGIWVEAQRSEDEPMLKIA